MSVCVKRPTIAVPAMSALTASAFSRKATLSAKMNAVIQKRIFVAEKLVVQRDKIVATALAVLRINVAETRVVKI